MRYFLASAGLAAAVTAVILIVLMLGREPANDQPVPIGGPFTLVDHRGETVTEAALAGSFALVYFGFTHCPDVCPLSLSVMAQAVDALDDPRVLPVFVTLDPERDTPEVVADYVGAFHDRMLGLTGTLEQVTAAAAAYHIPFAKAVGDGDADDYSIDHASIIFVIDPDGRYLAHFGHDVDSGTLAAKVREYL